MPLDLLSKDSSPKTLKSRFQPLVQRMFVLWKKVPFSTFQEAIFAEAIRQGLFAGRNSQEALILAVTVFPSRRVRLCEKEVTENLNGGYCLSKSLSRTGLGWSNALIGTLEIGEDRGCLEQVLRAFSQSRISHPGASLAKALGRKKTATRFAAALAALLKDAHFKGNMVMEAGRMAGGNWYFRRILKSLDEDVMSGASMGECLSRHDYFDPFYIELLKNQDDRKRFREVLSLLGNTD